MLKIVRLVLCWQSRRKTQYRHIFTAQSISYKNKSSALCTLFVRINFIQMLQLTLSASLWRSASFYRIPLADRSPASELHHFLYVCRRFRVLGGQG